MTYNLFLTAVLIPIGLFALFLSIKRLFLNKDEQDKLVENLQQRLHDEAIAALHKEMASANAVSAVDRNLIKEGIKSLDVQFKLLNGSLRAAETAIEVQTRICEERHKEG